MNNWKLKDFEKMFDAFSRVLPENDPKAKKQRRILDAAATLFEKWGYRKTSMDDVAREAGMAKGTLYLYFKTKADLAVQVIAEEKRRFITEMAPLLDEADPEQRIARWVTLGVQLGARMPITSRLATGDNDLTDLLNEMSDEDRSRSEAFGNSFLGALIAETKHGRILSSDERLARAKVLRAIITFSLLMANDNICSGLTLEQFSATLSHMLVHGAASGPRDPA
ncbi:MAG: TetR/AcrR family transcriptional regulator [Deltaproteobacteria bacterium]|nr:TetR/AcrR family transcriptional regulator [Deltaproteobacteria bacterium]MBN2672636.1 TetR/AcrR family transcriptional regulator [Deltaproteobacteria bacterium]